jgi:heavy metal efflux system protein
MGAFKTVYSFKKSSLLVALLALIASLFSFQYLGSEFLPQLDEGLLWVQTKLPMSVSLDEAQTISDKMMEIIKKFPEAKGVLSQIGRTNDGTDPKGFFNVQIAVDLKQKKIGHRSIKAM